MRLSRGVLLFQVVVVAACADRGGEDVGGESGGTIVMAVPGTGTSPTIPSHAGDAIGRLITDNVFERLATMGPGLNTLSDEGYVPQLAERWEWAADSMSIAFYLNPRARWHDGRPVRANDVRFTVNLLKDPKTGSQYAPLLANVDSVSVRDSLTAVVWYARRSAEQFYSAAYQIWVMPEHLLSDIPREQLASSAFQAKPVGSGRFRFARFDPGVRVELVADTTHYRGRPKLDRVILSFAGPAATALTRLLNGEADFLDIVPPDGHARVDSAPTLKRVPYDGLGYAFLVMNVRGERGGPHPLFGDRAVRRAISMSLDRGAMLANIFGNNGKVGSGPYPAALADSGVRLLPFDRARANALLDSTGWRMGRDSVRVKNGRPFAFGLMVPTTSASRMRYAVLIQEQLKGIGARVEIQSMDFAPLYQRMESGRFDATINAISQDPARSSATQYWSTAGIPPAGGNFGRYSNPAVDALIDSLAYAPDRRASDAQWRRAMQMIVDDAPAVWLYDLANVAGVHRRIRLTDMRPDGWWSGLPEWWIPANERIERDRIGLRAPAAQQ